MKRIVGLLLLLVACVLVVPSRADAYIGPGAGVTVLGTVFGFIAAIFFAIIGFVWYPIKRLLGVARSRRRQQSSDEAATL
jgi:hypothetical protein